MSFLPTEPFQVSPLIAFGLLLLVGAAGGYAAHRLKWLPSITGFIAAGFLIGPSGLGLLDHEAMGGSRILVDVALALILYRLGLSLDLREVRRKPGLLLVSLIESGATFGAVLCVLLLCGLPAVLAAVVAAIAISSSPAVLLHVAHEVGAEGRVTDTTKTLVALNNCLSFAAFSAVLPALHQAVGNAWTDMVFQPSYRLLGSILLGLAAGFFLHQMATRTSAATQYRMAIIIGSIMLAIGLAAYLKLSLLVVPLVMGVVTSTIEREDRVSRIEFGGAFELFFIVLFVYAGANLHLKELFHYLPLVLLVVLARTLAKTLSLAATSPFHRMAAREGFCSGLLLVPMAGLAIGLAQTTSSLFPDYATTVSTIILGSVVVFETVGPPVAAFAFDFCKESGRARTGHAFESAREP